MDKVQQPHDRLFRRIFGEPAEAAELLRTALPPEISDAIDWRTLRRVDRTFVDDDLRENVSDILFTADMNGHPVFLYVPFEHKSTDDPKTPFQLLRYSVRILEQHVRDHPDDPGLPVVLPIVFYHGAEPWQGPRRVRDLMHLDQLDPAVRDWLSPLQPDLAFMLHDLSATPAEHEAQAMSIVTWLSIRALLRARGSTLDEAEAVLKSWRAVLPQLLAHDRGTEVLIAVYSYLLSTVKCEPPQLDAAVRRLFDPKTSPIMTTIADLLRAEGQAEGQAKGRLNTLREVSLRQLEHRFGPLPEDAKARIQGASTEELGALIDRVLTAATLAEALGM